MRGFLQYLLIAIVFLQVLHLGSCGLDQDINKEKTVSAASTELVLFREGACKNNISMVSEADSELKDQIEQFFWSVTNFSFHYNKAHFPYLSAPGDLEVGTVFSSNPLKPLRLSKSLLLEELKALQREWFDKIGSKNHETAIGANEISSSVLVKIENLSDFERLHKKIHALRKKLSRLSALSCSMDQLTSREKFDVRPLFKLREQLEKGFDISDMTLQTPLIDLCSEYNTESLCSLELLMSRRKKSIDHYFENYESKYELRLASFFERRGDKKWSCFKSDEKIVVRIPFIANDLLKIKLHGTYSVLTDFVAEKWSNEKVEILLEEAREGEDALEISWTDGGLSFVKSDEPNRIYLSKHLNFSQLTITFAHELGHVLGFPDCYHEFYDKQQKEIIYYSLDPTGKNLMCTLSHKASIPDSYLDKLIQEVCL